MPDPADIEWGEGLDQAWVGMLGDARGEIRPHAQHALRYDARISTPAGSREPHTVRTMEKAIAWVEQELLRLAHRR